MNSTQTCPPRYKLIKKRSNQYRWGLYSLYFEGYETCQIVTWKGVYKIRLCPTNVSYDNTGLCTDATLRCEEPFEHMYPIVLWGKYKSEESIALNKCKDYYYHPIQHKWVSTNEYDRVRIHNDIIQWIESQPPAPDYEQAAKDRVEVAQTFAEF